MDVLKSDDCPLIVYVDVKSPYAFIAFRPTLALEAELGLRFDWRPLTLDIPSYLGSAEKKDGQVVRSEGRSPRTWNAIKYSYRDARRYAERQGLTLKGTEKIWDSQLANIGILWVSRFARDRLAAYLEAVYPAFWRRELDIEDLSVVEACLQRAGAPVSGFREFLAGEGREQHDSLQVQFHERGIYGVPTYVLGDEVIFGREHIPYLRWALSGQQGPAPDMAYELEPPRGAPQGETSEALTLYIDFKSPAAYLALQPTLDLIRRTRVPVRWRPFVTYERELPASASDPGRSQRHRDVRAASRQAILTKYAAEQGIELRFREPGVEAALALSVLTLAAEDPLPFIEAAFRAYWHDGLDLDDEATVQALLRRSGLSAPPWTAEEGRAALAWAQGEAEASGIVDAPAYVVGEHVFVGHAHLPWIEELLGRS